MLTCLLYFSLSSLVWKTLLLWLQTVTVSVVLFSSVTFVPHMIVFLSAGGTVCCCFYRWIIHYGIEQTLNPFVSPVWFYFPGENLLNSSRCKNVYTCPSWTGTIISATNVFTIKAVRLKVKHSPGCNLVCSGEQKWVPQSSGVVWFQDESELVVRIPVFLRSTFRSTSLNKNLSDASGCPTTVQHVPERLTVSSTHPWTPHRSKYFRWVVNGVLFFLIFLYTAFSLEFTFFKACTKQKPVTLVVHLVIKLGVKILRHHLKLQSSKRTFLSLSHSERWGFNLIQFHVIISDILIW